MKNEKKRVCMHGAVGEDACEIMCVCGHDCSWHDFANFNDCWGVLEIHEETQASILCECDKFVAVSGEG